MPTITSYAGQNWLITPVALAGNEAKPNSISDQKWLLLLTGVAVVNLAGGDEVYNAETITIFPDVNSPLNWAIAKWAIPVPKVSNGGVSPVFSLEEWAPFAAVSSQVDAHGGGTVFGFGVDAWRPTPFNQTLKDTSNNPIANVFTGVNIDISSMIGTLKTVSYHVTLLGKIVFTHV